MKTSTIIKKTIGQGTFVGKIDNKQLKELSEKGLFYTALEGEKYRVVSNLKDLF